MSRVALTLNILFGILWLMSLVSLVRRPPPFPASALGLRRGFWGTAAVLALGVGAWGVPLTTTTASDHPPHPEAGPPTDARTSFLRTPFALVERDLVLDGAGRTLRDERRETLQLPLVLLAFLAATLWWTGKPADGRRTAALAAILMCAGLGSCRGDAETPPGAAERSPTAQRPTRSVSDVAWDTLAHVRAGMADTTLFSAGSPAADSSGFVVLDHYGSRVARFDWSGNLLGYVGRRGGGPGELMGPREVELDGRGTLWVLDAGNARISGFDQAGELVDELSLAALPMTPSRFTVDRTGTSFRFMLNGEKLVPYAMDRATGTFAAGPALELGETVEAAGLALQGLATRTDSLDGWVYALGAGDGILPLRGVEWEGQRWRYPEEVAFPTQDRIRSRSGNVSTVTTRLSSPTFSAISVDAWKDRLYVVFMGEGPDAGRLLERWDLETGAYLDSVLLPRAGYIAVWEDRLVVAASNPEPEVLVLRLPWRENARE